jgi:hypothetical protein
MPQPQKPSVVLFVGNHPVGEYLSDVPPRSLTEAEAQACGYELQDLVNTTFYAWPEPEPESDLIGPVLQNQEQPQKPKQKTKQNNNEIQPPAPPQFIPPMATAKTPL